MAEAARGRGDPGFAVGVTNEEKSGVDGGEDGERRSAGVASWVSMGPVEGALLAGWPASVEERPGEDVPSVSSPTLAELYFQQGSPEMALEVYRELLVREPGNERASGRVRDIEALVARGEEGSVSVRDRQERVRQTIGRLEKWLSIVQTVSEREAR
jgi:hypothetical protein